MKITKAALFFAFFALTGCLGDEEESSSSFKYCSITESKATTYTQRSKDTSQCWTISSTTSKDTALSSCKTKVINYMNTEYGGITHDVTYQASTSSCY